MPFFFDTPFRHLAIFEPRIFQDERGYLFESYNQRDFEKAGIQAAFVQDMQAFSTQGVLRGMHYQSFPFAQAKLIRALQGEILDVVVDLREAEPTYGQWYSIRLSDKNQRQLFVPRGFAHGYLVLSPTALVAYKCDNFYAPSHEAGLRYDDPTLAINWETDLAAVIVSEKDKAQPEFGKHAKT
ncbi:MAG: dTDP-4-dehydrorhamnose 3,5-epimerase [Saprospirales bacterium]|nr:dTDP-4-dehydrorhamnose 3,5-epimerase [Saprospirales bacterium]